MLPFILIITSFFVHSSDTLKTDVDKYLKKNLSRYESFDYKILQIPVEYQKIQIMNNIDFNLCGNLVYIPVNVVTKNGRAIKSMITVMVKLYKSVLIAARSIERNQNLDSSDVEIKKTDITQIKGTVLATAKGIETYRARMFLKPGEPVLEEYIEPKPVILTGDKIEAKLSTGNVSISFDAFSRQDGIPGGLITIISKDKKQYRAKVIDSLNVNVIE